MQTFTPPFNGAIPFGGFNPTPWNNWFSQPWNNGFTQPFNGFGATAHSPFGGFNTAPWNWFNNPASFQPFSGAWNGGQFANPWSTPANNAWNGATPFAPAAFNWTAPFHGQFTSPWSGITPGITPGINSGINPGFTPGINSGMTPGISSGFTSWNAPGAPTTPFWTNQFGIPTGIPFFGFNPWINSAPFFAPVGYTPATTGAGTTNGPVGPIPFGYGFPGCNNQQYSAAAPQGVREAA